MKYILSTFLMSQTNLASDGDRNATGGKIQDADFYVCNAGLAGDEYARKLAVFGPSSNLRILQTRAVPLLAPGLREGSFFSMGSDPAFRARINFRSYGVGHDYHGFNLYLNKFNSWYPCDFIQETDGTGVIIPVMASFSAVYDAYQIKPEFFNKEFGFMIEMEVESSGGILP